jgi:mono/diheme cytochrome c family protein
MPLDPYERNAALWASQRAGATSGWQRGQELYYMKCWMCHSEYIIAADPFPAPSLRDVAKRLNDEQITSYIRNGTARMPAYGYQLSDADIKDLLALFKAKCGTFPSGGGCFDEHNPPPNPHYRF